MTAATTGPTGSGDRSAEARVLLAGDRYGPLWRAARQRLEGNGRKLTGTPLRLVDLTPEQRTAIAGLLGVSAAGSGPLSVRLAAVDDALRRGAAGIDLVGWLESLSGPLRDRRAERRAGAAGRQAAWAAAEGHPALLARPELAGWVAGLRRSGAATRRSGSPEGGAALVVAALDVVARLPVTTTQGLAVFAASCTGDAHGLDRDRALGALVAGALAVLHPDDDDDDDHPGVAAIVWRRRWARVGVVCDDLSTSALVLNLPVVGDDIVACAIDDHRVVGEPLRLTLRQLAGSDLRFRSADVYVCENPTVVAHAATLLDDGCRPLVCVEGQPNSAVHEVLRRVVAAGGRLRVHGDFDWDGLRIAATTIARYGADPWRMSTADYRAAAAGARVSLPAAPAGLTTPWAPDLVAAIAETGVAVYEEQVLDTLVDDLAR